GDRAFDRTVEAPDQVHERRLAPAPRAHQLGRLSGHDPGAHVDEYERVVARAHHDLRREPAAGATRRRRTAIPAKSQTRAVYRRRLQRWCAERERGLVLEGHAIEDDLRGTCW